MYGQCIQFCWWCTGTLSTEHPLFLDILWLYTRDIQIIFKFIEWSKRQTHFVVVVVVVVIKCALCGGIISLNESECLDDDMPKEQKCEP